MSINNVLDSIVKVCGSAPDVKYEPSRAIDVPRNVLDISSIKQAYDWQPKVTLEAGLIKTMDYIKQCIR